MIYNMYMYMMQCTWVLYIKTGLVQTRRKELGYHRIKDLKS